MLQVARWAVLTLNFTGPADSPSQNAFLTLFNATFTPASGESSLLVSGFFDGGTDYRIRFSPPEEGKWTFTTASTEPALDHQHGELFALPPAKGDHGPVASRGFGLYHADGEPHFSVGTTSYQWAHMEASRQQETLRTLRNGAGQAFNKLRMTVFPKWYVYNHQNPVEMGTAFPIVPGSTAANLTSWSCVGSKCPTMAGSFDLRRFNVSFFARFEALIAELRVLGVVADLILFHPYDRGHWGFDCLGGSDPQTYDTSHDAFYLRYVAARLAAFSNVWWSMANEWSFVQCKSRGINSSHLQSPAPIWDELFVTLAAADPYGRQKSIHNGNLLYNHSRPWITHVSLQGEESQTAQIRERYGKPVVWDEVKYEGDIPEQSGDLSGQKEAARFWWGASLGVYVGHSETILRKGVANDAQPLWWAKGGTLVGESPYRIEWFRRTWQKALVSMGLSFGELQPTSKVLPPALPGQTPPANILSSSGGDFLYLHFARIGTWGVPLQPPGGSSGGWQLCRLDYWGMKEECAKLASGASNATISVPRLPFHVIIKQVGESAETRRNY